MLNEPGDTQPWGEREFQALKDMIDSILDKNLQEITDKGGITTNKITIGAGVGNTDAMQKQQIQALLDGLLPGSFAFVSTEAELKSALTNGNVHAIFITDTFLGGGDVIVNGYKDIWGVGFDWNVGEFRVANGSLKLYNNYLKTFGAVTTYSSVTGAYGFHVRRLVNQGSMEATGKAGEYEALEGNAPANFNQVLWDNTAEGVLTGEITDTTTTADFQADIDSGKRMFLVSSSRPSSPLTGVLNMPDEPVYFIGGAGSSEQAGVPCLFLASLEMVFADTSPDRRSTIVVKGLAELYDVTFTGVSVAPTFEEIRGGGDIASDWFIRAGLVLGDTWNITSYPIIAEEWRDNAVLTINGNPVDTADYTEFWKTPQDVSKQDVATAGQLEKITESGKTGYALRGDNRAYKGDIGDGAVDLSGSDNWTHHGAMGRNSLAVGFNSKATGDYSRVGGLECDAAGPNSSAEGYTSVATGAESHAEGYHTEARNKGAHSEGYSTIADGVAAHAEGRWNYVYKDSGHVEGRGNEVLTTAPFGAHAEGAYANPVGEGKQSVIGIGYYNDNKDGRIMWTDGTMELPEATKALNDARGSKAVVIGEQLAPVEKYQTYPITATGAPLIAHKTANVDCSGGQVELVLHAVTAGDESWFGFRLCCNSNHCGISSAAGQFINGSKTKISLATVNSLVILKANGVDGWDLVTDTRVYKRSTPITADTVLANGFEAGATYECKPADGTTLTITIANWSNEHPGQEGAFVKTGGVNSKVVIKSVDETFYAEITEDDKQLTIYSGLEKYSLAQDSRSGESTTLFDLLTRVVPSSIDPTARKFQVDDFAEVDIESVVIGSTDANNPSVLSRFVDDDNVVTGLEGKRSINGVGRFKVGGQKNKIQVKFRYSAINKDTLAVTPLSETGWSAQFDNDITFSDYILEGSIPEFEFHDGTATGTGNLFQAEILAIKKDGNKNPTLQVRTGGDTPSKAVVGTAGANLSHSALKQVKKVATGERRGHVDNESALQIPELTTAKRDAESVNEGMIIFNTTTGVFEQYNSGVWSILMSDQFYKKSGDTLTGNMNAGGFDITNTALIEIIKSVVGDVGAVLQLKNLIDSVSTGHATAIEMLASSLGNDGVRLLAKASGAYGNTPDFYVQAMNDGGDWYTIGQFFNNGVLTLPETNLQKFNAGSGGAVVTKDILQAFATQNGLTMPT